MTRTCFSLGLPWSSLCPFPPSSQESPPRQDRRGRLCVRFGLRHEKALLASSAGAVPPPDSDSVTREPSSRGPPCPSRRLVEASRAEEKAGRRSRNSIQAGDAPATFAFQSPHHPGFPPRGGEGPSGRTRTLTGRRRTPTPRRSLPARKRNAPGHQNFAFTISRARLRPSRCQSVGLPHISIVASSFNRLDHVTHLRLSRSRGPPFIKHRDIFRGSPV